MNEKQFEITDIPAPISKAMLFICEKCGKKLTTSELPEENPARIIQKSMKKACVERFGKKVVRPMVSSCMDVCPEGRITIGIMSQGPNPLPPRFITVEPTETDSLTKKVLDLIK